MKKKQREAETERDKSDKMGETECLNFNTLKGKQIYLLSNFKLKFYSFLRILSGNRAKTQNNSSVLKSLSFSKQNI